MAKQHMFEWLNEEMARIKTRKFHLVNGQASAELCQALKSCEFPLPSSYKEFVLRFGKAELYRYSTSYYVTIFDVPREAKNSDGDAFIQFGRTWTSYAYFKESLLVEDRETPVFEWFQNCIRKTADGFEEWLKAKCKSARKRYKKKDWEAIEKGPIPFSDHERSIVEARKLFRWRVVGVALNNDLRFEIHNGSAISIPFLSVGIRGEWRPPKAEPLCGGCYLPTDSIEPGETKLVEFDCYKQFIAPENIEVFELPEPGPEDREYYWEFRTSV